MSTVYLVEIGEYSDHHVGRVFSDKSLAEEFAKAWNNHGHDYAKVTTWPVDERFVRMLPWVYVLMYSDGRVDRCWHDASPDDKPLSDGRRPDYGGRRYFAVQTDNEERAIKVANERRAQLLATNAWSGR